MGGLVGRTCAGVKQAIHCGLARLALGTEANPQPVAAALRELLTHGIRFAFPARPGGLACGVPRGFVAPGLVSEADELVVVWRWRGGKAALGNAPGMNQM